MSFQMNGMQPQQQQVQVQDMAQQLYFQPQQFAPNAPPFIPQIQTVPELQNYVGYLAAACANEVCVKVTNNQQRPTAIRILHFNLVARNNYQNQEYLDLVETSVNVLLYYMFQQQVQQPDQGITAAAQYATTICASMLTAQYPFLRSMVHPNQLNEVAGVLQTAQEIQTAVRNYKQRAGMAWAPPGGGGMIATTMGPAGGGQFVMGGGGMMPMMGGNNMALGAGPAPVSRHQNPTIGASLPNPTVATTMPPSTISADKYNYLGPGPSVAAVQPVAAPAAPTNVIDVTPKVTNSEMKYPERLDKIYFVAENVGFNMDRKLHTIAQNLFLSVPQDRQALLQTSVDTLIEAKDEFESTKHMPQDTDEQKELHEKALKELVEKWQSVTVAPNEVMMLKHLDASILDMRRQQMKNANQGEAPGIYQAIAAVYEPAVCSEQLRDKLSEVMQARQFSELAIRLGELMGNPDNTAADRLVLLQLDAYLTYEINSILANNLSIVSDAGIPRVVLNSFVDDVPPRQMPDGSLEPGVLKYLETKIGTIFSRALAGAQGRFIAAHCDFIGKEDQASVVEAEWLQTPIAVFDRRYSITLVNVLAAELGIRFKTAYAHAVFESEFPVLFKLIYDTLESYDGDNNSIAQHLLITADNQRFRLHRGMVETRCVMIEKLPR